MVTVQIDTSNNKEIIVGVQMPGKEDIRRQIPDHRKRLIIDFSIKVYL